MILTVLSTIMITGNTYLEGLLLNSLVYRSDRGFFLILLVTIVVIGFTRLGISYFTSHMQILTSQKVVFQINQTILKYLFGKKTLAIMAWDALTLSVRINDDVNEVISFFSQTVVQLVGIGVSVITIAIYVLHADARIFLMMAIFLPLYFVIYILFRTKIYRIDLAFKNHQNQYFSARNDFLSRYVEIKGKGSYGAEEQRLNRVQGGLFGIAVRSFWARYWLSTSQIVIQLVFQTLFFVIGGLSVLSGNITVGFFSIILQYFGQLLGAVDSLLTISIGIQSYRASLTRLQTVLNTEPDQIGTTRIATIAHVAVKDFNIMALTADTEVKAPLYTHSLTLTFENPGLYVITGDNGIGKSTLLRTITGIYQPTVTGQVLINGRDIETLDMAEIRAEKIGFLFQSIPAPHITVQEYLTDTLNMAQLQALQQREEFGRVFFSPQFDIHTLLAQKMDVLSTGETQLVKLLAAVGKPDAVVYVLDEPTANIYPELRTAVITLLERLAQKALVITVTHDQELSGSVETVVLR
ncbi:multidrug ABC transporter ATPase and permease [Schleiferilactobacillus perolens DSM 12744]|uniref:Multidrug ABC transporter ATPase and permease n=1 Tax=Schleiferilactobacillus perolens DSM 12744 TaxID=1423792 RepID=A0A0R1N651_9LACO|nr:ABC transporter ATP-binding protein [Schleiferilactobacillus perolens]KRL12419.1 multidrug ABC transporter ATPase and permease [Schleiferilactobacillus perolens DSM 12744]